MNPEIYIQVRVSDNEGAFINLKLKLKIYAKDDDRLYVWKTSENAEYFLAVMQNKDNYIYPENIRKDLRIETGKEVIAEQILERTPILD